MRCESNSRRQTCWLTAGPAKQASKSTAASATAARILGAPNPRKCPPATPRCGSKLLSGACMPVEHTSKSPSRMKLAKLGLLIFKCSPSCSATGVAALEVTSYETLGQLLMLHVPRAST